MFRNVPLLVLLGAVVGCARDSPTSGETSGIVGYWFGCEFGSSDSCQILDDDGAHFTADGEVYAIEESTRPTLPECGGSPCFRADRPSITITRGLIGTYSLDGTSLTVTILSCTDTSIFQIGTDFTENQSNCMFFDGPEPLVGKYRGTVTVQCRWRICVPPLSPSTTTDP